MCAREVGDFTVERARGAPSDRPAGSPDAVHDLAVLDGHTRRECTAQLQQDE